MLSVETRRRRSALATLFMGVVAGVISEVLFSALVTAHRLPDLVRRAQVEHVLLPFLENLVAELADEQLQA